jgi:hypothetical protein
MSPRAELVTEPVTGFIGSYVVTGFLIVLLTCWVMRWAANRWPRLGTFGLLVVAFGFNWVLGLFSELAALRSGLYTYGGAIRELSLFHGNYYQLPLYETTLNAVLLGGFACVRFFKNDRGETVAERGLADLQVRGARRTMLRGLALVGVLNAIFIAYNIGWAWFALNQDAWPADTIERPYLIDGVCGPGTGYACPGSDVPIPHNDSGHLGPNGNYVPSSE